MKREREEVEELCGMLNTIDIMDSSEEYNILTEAYEMDINDDKIKQILKDSKKRYKRYIKYITFEDDVKHIERMIIDFLAYPWTKFRDHWTFEFLQPEDKRMIAAMKKIDGCLINEIKLRNGSKKKREL
ncbi:MAG: hypothetical protein RLZZ546_1747 [Bacteroidota bacterium]|jgi:hypothetical protein